MRAIEKKIIDFLRDSDFSDTVRGETKNLSVRDSVKLRRRAKSVCLWSHEIFAIFRDGRIKFSFQCWQTPTTKRRIKVLLKAFSSCNAGIYQRNGFLIFTSDAGEFPIDSGEFPIDSNRVYMIVDGKPEATTDL